jgi:hypothetical protein
MTPDEIERLYQAAMLAAPMALLGAVMFLAVWLWPVRRKHD